MDVVSDLLDRCTSPENVVLDGPANVAWAVVDTEARGERRGSLMLVRIWYDDLGQPKH